MGDDVKKVIYGTIIGFLVVVLSWLGLIYVSSCGFTLSCNRAAPYVIRTPVPTLIPVSMKAEASFCSMLHPERNIDRRARI